MSGSPRTKIKKEQPFCGFTVKPKYPIHTRLRKHFPGHGYFEGRVAGFDGEFYDILYQDGDSEVFDITGFDSVEILAPLKTKDEGNGMQHPSNTTLVATTNEDNEAHDASGSSCTSNRDVGVVKKPKYEIPICPICTEEFTCDTANRESGRLPLQAIHCPHVICKECIAKIHLTFVQGDNNIRRKFVDCPICKRSKSFNVQEPTVCLTMCEMVELCQTINQQQKEPPTTDVSTDIRRRRMLRAAEERYEAAKRQRVGEPEAIVVSSGGETAASATAVKPDPAPSSSSHARLIPTVLICSGCRMARKLKKFAKDQVKKGVKDHRADIYCHECLVQCSNCHVNKAKDKYSSKQLLSKSPPVCRRCEDKATIRKRFGQKLQNITIQIQKWNSSIQRNQKSHLATAVQWPIVPILPDHQLQHNTELPDDLNLDGYSRETWALLENNPEGVWTTVNLRLLGNKAAGFIKFLSENKKSAYASFKLASGSDGFFVIPYDQPPVEKLDDDDDTGDAHGDVVLHCKYVIGLGLDLGRPEPPTAGDSTNEIRSYSGDTEGETRNGEEDYMTKSKLSNLLSKVRKTDKAISSMPQAVARQYIQNQNNALARPDIPLSSPGSGDWYRPSTMTIRKK